MQLYSLLLLLLLSATIGHVVADCAGSECFDIVFVIDGTGSAQNVEYDFKQSLLFMLNVTNMFTIGSSDTLFGLYVLMGQQKDKSKLTAITTLSLLKQLWHISPRTDGNMHTALSTIHTTYMNVTHGIRRKAATCVVVLLVRGIYPYSSKLNTAATLIKQEGGNIYAIKIGNFSSSQLQALVSAQDFLFDGRNINQLETFVKPLVESVKQQVINCAPSTDNKGRKWNRTAPGTRSTLPCDSNNVGSIIRTCSEDGVFQNPQYNCTRKDIYETAETIAVIINEIIGVSKTPVHVSNLNEALDNMLNQTMPQESILQEGDINNVQSRLNNIAKQTVYSKINTDVNFSTLLGIADNLIDTNNIKTWSSLIQNEDTGAETVVGTVDTLVNSMVSSLNVTSELTYSKRNMVVTITPTSTCQEDITRYDKSYYNLRLGCENVEMASSFSSVAYRCLSNLVTTKRIDDGNISPYQPLSSNNTLTVNTAVISLSLSTKRNTKLVTPVVLTFKPIKPSRTDAVCVSMDTYKTGVKYWTSSGCRTSRSSSGHVVCECDHLSNFAVLMSTYGTPAEHAFALMVISHVGGILSIICSALTVVIYVVLWLRKHRPIQNQRSTVLINLCCAICITYTLFLSGISNTNNKDGCTAIAMVLHYMFLVVIFALFGEGVMLAGMVLFPLKKWRTGRYSIPLSWSFPLVIIGISMGATKLSGYGDNTACWLSRDTGLIWAFLAPVVFVIVINIGIMAMAFRTTFQTRAFKNKSDKQKAKTGLRNLCILVPVMGVTWILGVFAVDERTVVFQYLFAIFNSLQGVFIFMMHCVFNKQVREAFKKEKGKLLSQLASSKQETQMGVFIFMMHCVFNKQVREAFKKEKGKLLSQLASSKQETQMKTLKSTTTSNDNTTYSETDALKGEDNKNTTPYRNQAIHLK